MTWLTQTAPTPHWEILVFMLGEVLWAAAWVRAFRRMRYEMRLNQAWFQRYLEVVRYYWGREREAQP